MGNTKAELVAKKGLFIYIGVYNLFYFTFFMKKGPAISLWKRLEWIKTHTLFIFFFIINVSLGHCSYLGLVLLNTILCEKHHLVETCAILVSYPQTTGNVKHKPTKNLRQSVSIYKYLFPLCWAIEIQQVDNIKICFKQKKTRNFSYSYSYPISFVTNHNNSFFCSFY